MLEQVAVFNILVSLVLAAWSLVDIHRRPPPMAVMKWVWPLTFVWGGVVALVLYLWFGRAPPASAESTMRHGQRPRWQSVALAAMHCGAGCTLADVLVEGGMFVLGLQLIVLGHAVFGNWMLDYAAALLIGVLFQYAAIAPMSDDPPGRVLWRAFKADVLSLSAWQVGMYGWMAISLALLPVSLMKPDHWVFWLMMQLAMLVGFAVASPVNWLLIHYRVKEAM